MKLLLVLASYLAPLVHKPSLAVGLGRLLLLTVAPPLLGLLVLTARLVRAPLPGPLLTVGLNVGAFLSFGLFAQRFVTKHRAAILARSHLRTWPRLRAIGLLAGAYLLFAVLLMAAQWAGVRHQG